MIYLYWQLKELHRIHKKQVELMEEMKGSKKPKLDLEEKRVNINELTKAHIQVGRNTNAPWLQKPQTRPRLEEN